MRCSACATSPTGPGSGWARSTGRDRAGRALPAGIGLGALYRRRPGKRDLVVAALRASTHELDVPPTGDAEADVLHGLVLPARSRSGGAEPLLAQLLADPRSEPVRAIPEAKTEPFAQAHRRRLERLIGPVADLEDRVAVAPAMIIMRLLSTRRVPTEDEIRERIMPLQRPCSTSGTE